VEDTELASRCEVASNAVRENECRERGGAGLKTRVKEGARFQRDSGVIYGNGPGAAAFTHESLHGGYHNRLI
jgi:hypothetical protein